MDVNTLSSLGPWEWPDDAAEVLLSVLQSDKTDNPDRRLAVELASSTTVMRDDLAQALLAILQDPDEAEAMRGAAAIALGPTLEELDLDEDLDGFDDLEERLVSEPVARAIRDGLRAAYLDAAVPKEVRRMALEASVRAQEDWHPAAVRAAYDSGDEAWRLTAVFGMVYVAGFEREILAALESANQSVRYQAVRAAGSWAVDAAWPAIRDLVLAEGIEKPLLLAAIEAAASIRPEEAEELLADHAVSDDEEIAEAVADALALAGRPLDGREDPF